MTLTGKGNSKSNLIKGHEGNNLLEGGDGNDTLLGNDGFDTLMGDFGSDRLFGGNDSDKLSGDVGNDILQGDTGNDFLFGGDGNDRLIGGGSLNHPEIDYLIGGTGADTFDLRSNDGIGYSRYGVNDYVIIKDFNLNEGDKILLKKVDESALNEAVLTDKFNLLYGNDSLGEPDFAVIVDFEPGRDRAAPLRDRLVIGSHPFSVETSIFPNLPGTAVYSQAHDLVAVLLERFDVPSSAFLVS